MITQSSHPVRSPLISAVSSLRRLESLWGAMAAKDAAALHPLLAPGVQYRRCGSRDVVEGSEAVTFALVSEPTGDAELASALFALGPRRAVTLGIEKHRADARARVLGLYVTFDPRTGRVLKANGLATGCLPHAWPEPLPEPLGAVLRGIAPSVFLERRDRTEARTTLLVRAFVDAWKDGNREALAALLCPDVTVTNLVTGAVGRGAGALFAALPSPADAGSRFRLRPVRWLVCGNRAFLFVSIAGRDEPADAPLRDGLLVVEASEKRVRSLWTLGGLGS